MNRYARRARRRRITGLIPHLAAALLGLGRRLVRHPRPLVLAALLAAMGGGLWRTARQAEAFRIRDVHMPADISLSLKEPLVGRNLWALDLRALADDLKRQQPWLRTVRVIRELPNAVRIEPVRRVARAQMQVGPPGSGAERWYAVDGEAFVLPGGTSEPHATLPNASGLRRGITSQCTGPELALLAPAGDRGC